jgi:hypothetical protein
MDKTNALKISRNYLENDTIIAVKDCILQTTGENCEKIFLFGSYAYGIPNETKLCSC